MYCLPCLMLYESFILTCCSYCRFTERQYGNDSGHWTMALKHNAPFYTCRSHDCASCCIFVCLFCPHIWWNCCSCIHEKEEEEERCGKEWSWNELNGQRENKSRFGGLLHCQAKGDCMQSYLCVKCFIWSMTCLDHWFIWVEVQIWPHSLATSRSYLTAVEIFLHG